MSTIKDYIAGQLNEEQTKAALHIETSSLILAGAGSGKTRTLIYKIAYLIFGKNIPVNRILAVTFTNKAAKEMKERLMKIGEDISKLNYGGIVASSVAMTMEKGKVEEDSLDDFLNNIQNNSSSSGIVGNNRLTSYNIKWIGTFHSIFVKILKEEIESIQKGKLSKNFTILDSNESQSVLKNILKRLNLTEILKVNEIKGFISKLKNEGLTPESFGRKANSSYEERAFSVYEQYQKALENSNCLDFDDLLLYPYIIFKKFPNILDKRIKKFDYIMVDEAQDTNWIQFELMKMLSGDNGNITLIGDDYQSIYGWRGALMENFLNVKKYRPDIQMFKLQINYRSKPHIVDAGSYVIKKNVNQYEKNISAHREGNDKIVTFSHNSEMDEAANIVEFIKKVKGTKIENWGDVAILYRTNAQSSPFEQIFIQEGVPYKVRGAFKFFERQEIKDIVSYLKFLLNIHDNVSLKRILNVPGRKIGKTSQDAIEEYSIKNDLSMGEVINDIENCKINVSSMAKNGIISFKKIIYEINSKINTLTPSEVILQILKLTSYKDYLVKEEGPEKGEERYENIGQLINMAGKYNTISDDRNTMSDDKNKIVGIELLRQFMEEVTLLSDISEDEKGSVDAVKLMTVHSSKGLEFPMVFIAGLEDNIFPLSGSIMDPKQLEEERRLMYVAITRAKDHLFLSYADSRMQRGQTRNNAPSRFIGEIQPELLKKYDLGGEGKKRQENYNIDEGDIVKHKLFGTGYVLEVWTNLAIVKFHNPKFGVRKMEMRFLEKM